jgi:hypothetical protein
MIERVVQVYKTKYETVAQPPGIGDFILGAMSLFNLYEDRASVDYSEHPISNFLCNECSVPGMSSGDVVNEFFNKGIGHVDDFVKDKTGIIKVITNARIFTVTTKLKEFIINSFLPTRELCDTIDKELEQLGLVDYETIHIRAGDNSMFHDTPQLKVKLNEIGISFQNNKNVLLVTDNAFIKNYLTTTFHNIKSFKCTPIHLGLLKEADEVNIKNTLLEFFMMATSKKISCYSVYGGSGFSQVISLIYDIPYNAYKI